MAERVRLEEEEPAQRSRFFAERGHTLAVKTGSTAKNAKNAEKNRDGRKELAASWQSPDESSPLNSLCDLCVLCG